MHVWAWLSEIHKRVESPILRGLIILALAGVALFLVCSLLLTALSDAVTLNELTTKGTSTAKAFAWAMAHFPFISWPWPAQVVVLILLIIVAAWVLSNGSPAGMQQSAQSPPEPFGQPQSSIGGGWKDPSIWRRVEPTMPPDSAKLPAINAAKSGPLFAFELGLGNSQAIEFDVPLRINLKGVLQLASGEEQYGADIYIDSPAAQIEAAHEAAEIGHHHFYIPRAASGTVYGQAAGFICYSEFPGGRQFYRVFSVGVTHVNPTRGIVTFLVLCHNWYVEHG
jgi:hypothetical protein